MKALTLARMKLPLLLGVLILGLNALLVLKMDLRFFLNFRQTLAEIAAISLTPRFLAVGVFLIGWIGLLWTTRPFSRWPAAAGIAAFLALSVAAMGIELGPTATSLLVALPFLGAFFLSKKEIAFPAFAKQKKLLFFLPLLAPAVIDRAWNAFYEGAFHRGPAVGDELTFWWTASTQLLGHGLGNYVGSFPLSNYNPGYPLLVNFLLWFVPVSYRELFLYAVPLALGLMLVFFLRDGKARPWWLWLAVAVVWIAQFLGHGWSYTMFFVLWFGEPLAILCFALVLRVIYEEKESKGAAGIFISLGIGALAILSKPPLTSLLFLAILPTLFLAAFFLPGRKKIWQRIILVGAGAWVTAWLWRLFLQHYHLPPYYSFDLAEFTTFRLHDGPFPQLVSYFLAEYKRFYVTFLLTTAMALLCDWRRYLGPVLCAYGLTISIFLLYATKWSGYTDYESGARYILHGILGWTLFFLTDIDAQALWPQREKIV